MKNLLKQLSENLGYEVHEQYSPSLYYHLMALQVGLLDNSESKNKLKLIENIILLAKICKIILENMVELDKIIFNALGTKSSRKSNNENQSETTCSDIERKCNCSK